MDEQIMVTVPYSDFYDGVCAVSTLAQIIAILEAKQGYCSDEIRTLLGLAVDGAGAD